MVLTIQLFPPLKQFFFTKKVFFSFFSIFFPYQKRFFLTEINSTIIFLSKTFFTFKLVSPKKRFPYKTLYQKTFFCHKNFFHQKKTFYYQKKKTSFPLKKLSPTFFNNTIFLQQTVFIKLFKYWQYLTQIVNELRNLNCDN